MSGNGSSSSTKQIPPGHSIVFVIDLWSAKGPAPETMEAVFWRAKRIQYASRTPLHVDWLATKVNLRHTLQLLEDPGAVRPDQRLDLVHILYHPDEVQIPSSDVRSQRRRERPALVERHQFVTFGRLSVHSQNKVARTAAPLRLEHRATPCCGHW